MNRFLYSPLSPDNMHTSWSSAPRGPGNSASSTPKWPLTGSGTRMATELDDEKCTTQREPWKPKTLRSIFLGTVIFITLLMIVAIQLLHMQSQKNGGLIFAPNISELPLSKTFLYNNFPSIIFVAYGMIWAWIDMDIRRMEPYFQLSKPGGATGRESLLLHYPSDFLASVPTKALKFKHWAVFVASLAVMLTTWGLTPVQAGIFATSTVNITRSTSTQRSTQFLPLSKQETTLSTKSVYSAMNILWLNETLPPFVTRDYAVAPFTDIKTSDVGVAAATRSLTGMTKRYGADISCEEPIQYLDQSNITFLNSTWGCHMTAPSPTLQFDESRPYQMIFAGYKSGDSAQYSLDRGACPQNQSNTFLIQYSKPLLSAAALKNYTAEPDVFKHFNITRRWCRSNFYVQDAEVTISNPAHEILNFGHIGTPVSIPGQMFNITGFEEAINLGAQQNSQRTNFPTTSWPDQSSFLYGRSISVTNLDKITPFAIGSTQRPAEDYLDPTVLVQSIHSAYSLLFALQMSTVVSEDTDPASSSLGSSTFATEGIVVVPVFAYIAQGLLAATVLTTIWIWRSVNVRPLHLCEDPASINSIMELTANDKALLQQFGPHDQASNERLEECFSQDGYQLQHRSSSLAPAISLTLPRHENNTSDQSSISSIDRPSAQAVNGIYPKEFLLRTGVAFVFLLIFGFILLPILYWKIMSSNGLPLPSQNQIIRQLIENYLPTAVGTLIEPFWVVLNRNLCLLEPIDSLRKGQQSGENSIALDYSSLPPQFVFWKALKRKHILLAMVCFMSLLAHVFAIALSALFFENTVFHSTTAAYSSPYSLHFVPLDGLAVPFTPEAKGFSEPFFAGMSNDTAHTLMPSWADKNWFYLPFIPLGDSQNSTWTHRAETQVIGGSVNCDVLQTSIKAANRIRSDNFTIQSALLEIPIELDVNGSTVHCLPRAFGNFTKDIEMGGAANGSVHAEGYFALAASANDTLANQVFCSEHFVAAWLRAKMNASDDGYLDTSNGIPSYNLTSFKSSALICRGAIETGTAEVLTDSAGHVLQQLAVKDVSKNVSNLFTTSSSDLLGQMHQFIIDWLPLRAFTWANDSFPSDFNNYLLELDTNSSAFLDPNSSPPNPKEMIAPVAAQYSKLFSIMISQNMGRLLEPNANKNARIIGSMSTPQVRIFMSKSLFIIAEVILGLYICTAVALYLRRPWKILARLPTSIGSVLAYYAASHAVEDYRSTATQGDQQSLITTSAQKYGFGTFIGTDEQSHLGIEKHPYVIGLTRTTTGLSFKSENMNSSNISTWKLFEWQPGSVKEGGWL
ncbi:hypothetical protein BT63DRAFT_66774 [Microthyrium microscopicum]|uniref:Uncharacterized protein n=1 Tax=Microthyrium microscopicum TaxID=703497 RepID=A0A6A6U207_9PEZI|nr:hypothetical protein BT63DRAFT_66774 [Microthyrium microscopicum]